MIDLTILIQGNVTAECLKFYYENYKNFKVIISTWDDLNIDFLNNPHQFTITKSEKPKETGQSNLFLQVESTKNGLYYVNTDYCIKIRGDAYYSNIENIYHKIKSDNTKIYTSPIYFRHPSQYKYHISDHIIAGTTDNLKKMFYNIEVCGKDTPPEVELCINYLKKIKFNFDINEYSNHIMIENFNILDLKELHPYFISTNTQKIKKHTHFIPEKHNSISNISMLYNTREIQQKIFKYYEQINLS
jgi:hypothetical protein